jgi:hypothetical protein
VKARASRAFDVFDGFDAGRVRRIDEGLWSGGRTVEIAAPAPAAERVNADHGNCRPGYDRGACRRFWKRFQIGWLTVHPVENLVEYGSKTLQHQATSAGRPLRRWG